MGERWLVYRLSEVLHACGLSRLKQSWLRLNLAGPVVRLLSITSSFVHDDLLVLLVMRLLAFIYPCIYADTIPRVHIVKFIFPRVSGLVYKFLGHHDFKGSIGSGF